MKIATRKITLYILSFVFAICLGAFAFVSMGNTKTVNADDPTEKNVTFTGLDLTWNNYAYSSGGYTKYSFLKFSGGISSGSHVAGNMDFSDLIANTTYTGSSNTWNLYPSSLIWGVDKENNNSIIFRTVSNPQGGDTLRIKAGAWFITGGDINEKYVITSDIVLWFNGTAWVKVTTSFALGNDAWSGADQSGKNGAQLTAWGIANDGNAAAYPTSGTFALLTVASSPLAIDPSVNYASYITGIKYNGTPISEISGAVVAEWSTYLAIYVPYRTGIVHFEKDTIIASGYLANDYYYTLSVNSGHGRMTAMNFAETTSFSFKETTTGIAWNGYNGGSTAVNGIEPSTAPESGVCNLINVPDFNTLYSIANVDNNLVYAPAGKTVLCDGTPLSEIEGAYMAIVVGYVFIYVPSNDSIITIQEGTRLGLGYYVDKDYTYHFKKGANQSSLCYLVDFDSNGGTEVADVYVHNGATVAAPTAPTKASVGNTSYTFDCWLDDGDNEYNFSTAVTGNITLTASWTEITTVNVTLNTLDGTENNFSSGDFYYTRLKFNVGISTGVSGQEDFSNFIANTTYSGSSVAYSWVPGSTLGWPANTKSDIFNFIYLMTTTAPTAGDCITVKASAWFTTGGTIEEKYVVTSDFGLTFDGEKWTMLPKFTIFDSRDESIITKILETKDGSDFVYTLPSDLSYVGYKVFGFVVTDGGVGYFYPAGGVHKSSNNSLAFVAIIGTFNMVNGASIRITTAETSGIRWQASVDKVTKDDVLYWGETGTTFGMEISAEGFTANFDIKTKYWANDTTYNAVLSDVNSDYYTTEFTAKAYVDVVYSDGTTTRFYADNTGVTRTIAYVAGAALDDPLANWSDRQTAILTTIAGR